MKLYVNIRERIRHEFYAFESLRQQSNIIIIGPLSIDRFPEVDDDVEVDVEQCSDSEAPSRIRTPRTGSHNSRATPTSDEERLTPEPVRKKV